MSGGAVSASITGLVRVLGYVVLTLAIESAPALADGPARPQRIASLNVCTDQLALMLGARDRLVSVTFLAADPSSSALPAEARGLRLNRGRAEEILPLDPDLVLAGDTAATPTVQLLKRLGRKVLVVPLARSLKDIPRNIETLARAIDEEARGHAMIARFRKRLRELTDDRGSSSGPRPVAMLIGPNGITSGAESLAGAIIEAAGLENGAARFKISGVGRLPLERVLSGKPDLLILASLKADHPSIAGAFIRHPALTRAFGGRTSVRIHHHVWACGSPLVLDAIERLAKARKKLGRKRKAGAP